MKAILVLSITSMVFGYQTVPQQQWVPPQTGWGPPEQPAWGPPPSPPPNPPPSPPPNPPAYPPAYPPPNPTPNPPPANCGCVPKNATNIAFYPIVCVNVETKSVYTCDQNSRVKEISYLKTKVARVTCSGIIVTTNDDVYDLVYAEPSYPVPPYGEPQYGQPPYGEPQYGQHPYGKQNEQVTITNYTQITEYNMGNANYYECGTIATGRCAGDQISGTGLFRANDPSGCCKGGNTGVVGVYRTLEINGKCESKCTLTQSTQTYSDPVSKDSTF